MLYVSKFWKRDLIVFLCVCVCVCMCVEGGWGGGVIGTVLLYSINYHIAKRWGTNLENTVKERS